MTASSIKFLRPADEPAPLVDFATEASMEMPLGTRRIGRPSGVSEVRSGMGLETEAANPALSDELAAALANNARLMQENAYLRIEMQQHVSLRTILQRELVSLQARYPECASEFGRLVRCIEQHEQLRRQRLPGASLQADLCSESEGLLPSSGTLIVQLNEALKRTLDMQDKNEQALAIRMGRLLALAQKAGLEQEFKRIVAGSPVPGEPPGYSQLVNTLRFRAERAERDIAHYVDKVEDLERRMDRLAQGFMDAVSGLESENARLRDMISASVVDAPDA